MVMNRVFSFVRRIRLISLPLRPGPARAGAIHDALDREDAAGAKALLEADPALANSIDMRGRTPLHTAVKAGHNNIAVLLLDKGATINAQNSVGRSALHFAAARGHNEIVELLLARGADPTLKDIQGQTPLDQARQLANEQAVKLLQAARRK
jgi:ankyrin repeat protein